MSAAELRTAGLSEYDILRAEKCCLRRVRRGIYVVTKSCAVSVHRFVSDVASDDATDLPRETEGQLKRNEDLRIMVRSYVGKLLPHAVFSHRSALIIHGLAVPFIERDGDVFAESVHPRCGLRRPSMQVRRRSLDEQDVVPVDGIPVTSVLRTLFDLARDYPLALAVAAIDDALHRSVITEEQFQTYVADHPVRTRQRRIETVLENVDGRRESVGESITAVRFVEFSVPGLEPQVVIVDENGRFVARTDFANRQAKVVAEFDGAGKYHLKGVDPKKAFEQERRREYALRNLGYEVFRLTWQDLFSATQFLRIRAAIERRTPQRPARSTVG
ncbi:MULTISPECIES: hypothetical protein [unclassified Brevibacterium]|uniref:hypothetical protein n=1 Tax=unclassified Brevibacterium TaxID=2614124 RepID=UPI0010F92F07|nr:MULTISPECIES: hypothetical protein [unclassified Brevibacterium]MCM1011676.1 endonuclease domain-containing protein [Brevibacterium sp. XM4083]